MPAETTRRDFLRFGAAALGSPFVAAALPSRMASARAVADGPALEVGSSLLSQTGILGTPVDVGIGTDGVHWVVADSGAPSAYDPVEDLWLPFGGRIDAASYVPHDNRGSIEWVLTFFRGNELFRAGSDAPTLITDRWPGLPIGFQRDLAGAVPWRENGVLLIKGSRGVAVTYEGEIGSPEPLENLFGSWPGGDWAGGRFDFIVTGRDQYSDAASPYANFVRGDEYIQADLWDRGWAFTPARKLDSFYQGSALGLLSAGDIQVVLADGPDVADVPLTVITGPAAYVVESATSTAPAKATYVATLDPNWPQTWHPRLSQAPAGRVGSLWSVDSAGTPLVAEGNGWTAHTAVEGGGTLSATDVDVGIDGSVVAVDAGTVYQLGDDGSWAEFGTGQTRTWEQVSVIDLDNIWLRDSEGLVWDNVFTSSTRNHFVRHTMGVTASDIGANPDGTVWVADGGAQAYRAVTGSGEPAEPVDPGQGVSAVQRVASSSFGTGLFLALKDGEAVLVRLSTPYVFKTDTSYFNGQGEHITQGASSLFMFTYLGEEGNEPVLAAIDTQTGAMRWHVPYDLVGTNDFGNAPLYDPQHQLVYAVGSGNAITAYDAQTGSTVWRLSVGSPLRQPVLSGGLLLFHGTVDDKLGYLGAIDTLDAIRRAREGEAVQERWRYTFDDSRDSLVRVDTLAPVVSNGRVYFGVWQTTKIIVTEHFFVVVALDAGTGESQVLKKARRFSSSGQLPDLDPIVAQLKLSSGYQGPCLVLAAPDGLYATPLEDDDEWVEYDGITDTNPVVTQLLYHDGLVYVGDKSGHLHILDGSFAPVSGVPFELTDKLITSMAVVPGQQSPTVAFVAGTEALQYFSTDSSNVLTVETSFTVPRYLSAVSDGVIYAGGFTDGGDPIGEVFGIRVGGLSALRDFVIESELMQDYDPGAKAVARYQTHVSVVDGEKVAQPGVALKLWADQALTVIVAGSTYDIGPDTPLSTQADAAGTLTILSDATDLVATPLRLWAAFMDPFERIVIYPDEAFHRRLPSMTADASDDDPTTINLATGTAYGGTTPLLTQDQATSAAKQISGVSAAMGLGGTKAATASQVTSVGSRLKAYPDMVGYRTFSADTPATRTVSIQGAYGLRIDGSGGFSAMTPAEAAALIDGLESDVEVPPGAVGSLWGDITDAWHDFTKGVLSFGEAVISVGKDVYVGLTYTIDGVTHVLRQVIHDVEDVVHTIGAFFAKLIAEVKEIIELLSLLLHFEEIIKTYRILKSGVQGAAGAIASILQKEILPSVTTFFTKNEQEIVDAFCSVKKSIDPNATCGSSTGSSAGPDSPAVSTFGGVGSTMSSVSTVAPKGGGAASSHAVRASWGIQKVKDHYANGTTAAAAVAGDPVADFFTGFAEAVSSNAQLQEAFTQTERDFADSLEVTSAKDFLQLAIVDLLDILEDLLEGGLVIVEALFTQLLKLGEDLVGYLMGSNGSGGILNQPIHIPIISDLFELIVDDELTLLNLALFVGAIPVTILYRVIEGSWLSDQADASAGDLLTLTPLARAFGILEVFLYVVDGIFTALADAFVAAPDGAPPLLNLIVTAASALIFVVGSSHDDAVERVNAALWLLLVVVGFLSSVIGPVAPVLLCVLGVAALVTYIVEKADDDADWLAFSGDVLSEVPALVRPLEYLAATFPVVTSATLAAIDMLAHVGAAGAYAEDLVVHWEDAALGLPSGPAPPSSPKDGPPGEFIPPGHHDPPGVRAHGRQGAPGLMK